MSSTSQIDTKSLLRTMNLLRKQTESPPAQYLLIMRREYEQLRQWTVERQIPEATPDIFFPTTLIGLMIEVFDRRIDLYERGLELLSRNIQFIVCTPYES